MIRSPFRLTLALCLTTLLHAQNLKDFEKRVTEFTLDNGMHFIVLERHDAPVVSFHAHVDVGGVNDPGGQTGMAHMFEHMIGKGTATVGTKNWPEEEKALKAVETAYDRVEELQRRKPAADPAALEQSQAALKAAIERANSLVEPNAYVRVIEENGAVGFNAGTGPDSTVYFYSLPANRTELWYLLASDWIRRPIYREFYKERDVVREERRMRVESSPQGKLMEAMMTTAFAALPYRTLIGWASDIERLRAKDADAFHRKYYVPGNITIAIAGDIDPAEAKRLAAKYFASIPAGPLPEGIQTVEPKQEGEKRAAVETAAQPFLLIGYQRPSQRDKDDAVFDVLAAILSSGRTGLLYKELVRDKKISLGADVAASFPGSKYSSEFVMISVPGVGHTVEENEKAIYEIIERLQKEKVDEETLARVKTKVRASVIRQLASNSGLASQMASFHVNYGNWRVLFTGIDDIAKVTADDVLRVAREYLKPATRTVAFTVAPKTEPMGEQK